MIRLEGVDFRGRIGQSGQRSALSALTFDVPRGGFRWITGPTGSGKSSLIALLSARHRPDTGQLRLLGVDVGRAGRGARARLRRRIGVIDEHRDLLPGLTVLENTVLPLRINGQAAATARIDALDMLEWVGLGRLADRPAGLLSRGERLLAAVARACIVRSALLLADEPTAELGDADGDRLFQLILEMNRLGTTILVASRNERLRRAYPASCLALENGRLREHAA